MTKLEKQEQRNFIHGPWRITDTVYRDRRNLFCLTPENEHHIGTIISGSHSKIERFETSLSIIRLAPDMLHKLVTLLELLKATATADTPLMVKEIREIEDLLSRANARFIEG